jgi:3-oxoacyl-[acyl-carrier protein] reductase
MRLNEKVAIVTGGAAGIGRQLALGLAAEGAKIVVADVNEKAAEQLVQSLRDDGKEALAVGTDVSSAADVERMVRETVAHYDRIDILVNNAAIYQRVRAAKVPVWEMSPEEWNRVLAVNLTGVFLCCRTVLPLMVARGGGKIVNIGSAHALAGTKNFAHYVASKGGVMSLTKALAREVGRYNITVNCLAPGSILSEDSEEPEVLKFRGAAVAARAIKRIGYPQDLVGAAVFLVSSDSDFVTGQTLVVDGGALMR